ncbi:hypothetical protein BH23BAC1_BH23BAC1_00320 [soil metagenome]
MIEPDLQDFYGKVLFKSTGQEVNIKNVQFVSGGCINTTIKLTTDKGEYFLKWNEADYEDMFSTEAEGLNLLRSAEKIKIPEIVGLGKIYDKKFLLLEYINSGAPSPEYWEKLGHSLAAVHKNSNAQYGLSYDNFIGALPQKNDFKKE